METLKTPRTLGLLAVVVWSLASGTRANDEAPAAGQALASPTEPYSQAIMAVEDNRDAVISALLGQWQGQLDDPQAQLAATLPYLSPHRLYAAQQAVTSAQFRAAVTPVQAPGKAQFVAVPAVLGDAAGDWSYTAVEPCRVVDTRLQSSPTTGPIPSGGTREFYVWGPVSSQNGGTPALCPAPRGEPLGVHVNVTVLPQAGRGNLRVYPADIATPTASLLNYSPGVNIGNAATIKTFASVGRREIEVFASATAHVVIDVLGYYYAAPAPIGVEYTVGSNHALTGGGSWEAVRSISINAPTDGYVKVDASWVYYFNSAEEDRSHCALSTVSGATGGSRRAAAADFDSANVSVTYTSAALTSGFAVTAGENVFYLNCVVYAGSVQASYLNMTAMFSPYRY